MNKWKVVVDRCVEGMLTVIESGWLPWTDAYKKDCQMNKWKVAVNRFGDEKAG
jgi:hypothetical protein